MLGHKTYKPCTMSNCDHKDTEVCDMCNKYSEWESKSVEEKAANIMGHLLCKKIADNGSIDPYLQTR